MPKGVDHFSGSEDTVLRDWVQKSLMPKGVDHLPGEYGGAGYKGVQKSLMPKGVDHRARRFAPELSACAKIFDAERR